MSGHGNGNGIGNGNGTGNGNGIAKKAWDLAEDGMLWKTVLDYTTKEFEEQAKAFEEPAKAFIAQLQESVQPADALQGLLLDRIAAGHLRKQLVLETEAAGRANLKQNKMRELSGYSAEAKRRIVVAFSGPLQNLWPGLVMKYEALLDQALHRDLILLQQLKKAAAAAAALNSRIPPKSDRELIEGEVAHSDVG